MTSPAPAQSTAPVSNEQLLAAAGGVFSELVGQVLGNEGAVFIPRGGMCRTCTKLSFVNDCTALPFNTMPVSKVYPDGVRAVRCTEYVRDVVP
jgi:hypothetical protein